MRRIWASGAVLALVLSGVVVAADDDAAPDQGGWGYHGLYRHKDKPVAKPVEQPKPDPEEAKQPKITFAQEQNALSRRLAVCDKLRNIALETHDTELENQANNLERQVNQLFQQRAGRLVNLETDEKPSAKASASRSRDVASASPLEVKP